MIKKENISLVIADDHPMLLKGLYNEFTKNHYSVIGQAKDGMHALELILRLKPKLAILDINMPLLTGFDVIKMIKDKGIDTKFIILSYLREIDYIKKAKSLYINGYLLKEDSFLEIEHCIEAVLNDKVYFSPSFDDFSLKNATEELKKIKLLTPSEITILKLIALKTPNTELANTLGVSIRTIEKHRSNMVHKLGIEGVTNSVTYWALKNKDIISNF